jgi:predicted aspartyl protease
MSGARLVIFLCVSLLVVDVGCRSEGVPATAGPTREDHPIGVPAGTRIADGTTTVPVKWAGSFPLVSVMLNGRGPHEFVLDTGLTGLVLSPRIAGNRYTGRWAAFDDSMGRVQRCPIVKVHSLTIANAEFVDLEAIVLPLDGLVGRKHGVEVLGVIGIRTFAQCRLGLDLAEGQILLEEPAGRYRLEQTLPLEVHKTGLPSVLLEIGGTRQSFTIDTGSDAAVCIPGSVAAKLGLGPPTATVTRRYFHGVAKTQRRVLRGSLWVGRHEVPHPPISVGTRSSLIGMPILKQFRVVIDQPAGTVEFAATRPSENPRLPPPDEGTDVATMPSEVPGAILKE